MMKNTTKVLLAVLDVAGLLLLDFLIPVTSGGQIAVKTAVALLWIIGFEMIMKAWRKKNVKPEVE